MAKKKPQRAVGGRKHSRGRAASRKTTARKMKRAATRRASAGKRKAPKKKAARTARAAKATPRKAAKSRAGKPKATAARKTARATTKPATAPAPQPVASKARRATRAVTRRAPNLDRERRTVTDGVPTPPSSLDLDRSASAARSGRAELNQRFREHTSTGPAMTAGDVDADWESAEAIGDEAPGGDNPTPDQDVVDEIGKALGVEYDDDEELQGGDEITERDRNRWELDPASSDDFDDRED
jgi:Family of unknown function (DUF6335)